MTVDVRQLCDDLPVRVCPRCGRTGLRARDSKAVHCPNCDFLYYHNNAAGTGVAICCDDDVLFIERAYNPAQGKLDVPGGFVDYGETLEEAALRETREEVGLVLPKVDYLASFPNVYRYNEVVYSTCDAYFIARFETRPQVRAADDAAACHWRRPRDVAAGEMAFDSVRGLLHLLKSRF
jgi:ADP-ribose pyrophosphatase YjhB (NUDIX family)